MVVAIMDGPVVGAVAVITGMAPILSVSFVFLCWDSPDVPTYGRLRYGRLSIFQQQQILLILHYQNQKMSLLLLLLMLLPLLLWLDRSLGDSLIPVRTGQAGAVMKAINDDDESCFLAPVPAR
jgi:hypothetical protein